MLRLGTPLSGSRLSLAVGPPPSGSRLSLAVGPPPSSDLLSVSRSWLGVLLCGHFGLNAMTQFLKGSSVPLPSFFKNFCMASLTTAVQVTCKTRKLVQLKHPTMRLDGVGIAFLVKIFLMRKAKSSGLPLVRMIALFQSFEGVVLFFFDFVSVCVLR